MIARIPLNKNGIALHLHEAIILDEDFADELLTLIALSRHHLRLQSVLRCDIVQLLRLVTSPLLGGSCSIIFGHGMCGVLILEAPPK